MIMMKTVMLITRVVVTRTMVTMVILGIVVAQVIMIMMVMLSNPCYHSTVAIILPSGCSVHCTSASAFLEHGRIWTKAICGMCPN